MEEQQPPVEKTQSDMPGAPPEDDVDDLTAELVAFLDGELDPDQSERTGGKISLDRTVRAEADALKKTWDMLDYLPRPEPSANFAERTMSRIDSPGPTATLLVSGSGNMPAGRGSALNGQAPTTRTVLLPRSRRKWTMAAVWLLACTAAGASGYFVRAAIVSFRQDQQQHETDARILSQAGLLQSLQNYRHIDDFKFLTELDDPELFGDEHPSTQAEGGK